VAVQPLDSDDGLDLSFDPQRHNRVSSSKPDFVKPIDTDEDLIES
jgi:hypothetical protein